MATSGKIVQGPSKYDIMISFFEEKPVQFTTDKGKTFATRVDTLHDHSFNGKIAPWESYPNRTKLLDYLIAGDLHGSGNGGMRLYIEYGLNPRFGHYTLLTEEENYEMVDLTYAPAIWAKIMGFQTPV